MNTATAVIVSIIVGFLPMLFFAWIVYWVDRYEKEPGLLLGVVFVWGAVLAAGAAFLVNTVLGLGVYLFTRSDSITESDHRVADRSHCRRMLERACGVGGIRGLSPRVRLHPGWHHLCFGDRPGVCCHRKRLLHLYLMVIPKME